MRLTAPAIGDRWARHVTGGRHGIPRQELLLEVALDLAGRSSRGVVGVLAELLLRAALTQQVPALVEGHLDLLHLGLLFLAAQLAALSQLAQLVLPVDQRLHPAEDLFVAHNSGLQLGAQPIPLGLEGDQNCLVLGNAGQLAPGVSAIRRVVTVRPGTTPHRVDQSFHLGQLAPRLVVLAHVTNLRLPRMRAIAGDMATEDAHQQYLAKNPFGYRCHANTGVRFPS